MSTYIIDCHAEHQMEPKEPLRRYLSQKKQKKFLNNSYVVINHTKSKSDSDSLKSSQ